MIRGSPSCLSQRQVGRTGRGPIHPSSKRWHLLPGHRFWLDAQAFERDRYDFSVSIPGSPSTPCLEPDTGESAENRPGGNHLCLGEAWLRINGEA